MLTLEKVAFPETTGIRLFSMAPKRIQFTATADIAVGLSHMASLGILYPRYR